MLLTLLFAVQLSADDSVYSSHGLKQLVARAAVTNQVPVDFAGYRASVESDIAVIAPDPRGLEHATQLEQIASRIWWRRGRDLEQHVVGYRSRGGLSISALTVLRRPWIIPSLYGDRLHMQGDSGRRISAVHPLAADRDSFYQFAGGDTVVTLQFGGRRIPIVRVHVAPRPNPRSRVLVFRGDLDLDAARGQIVRMRGELGVARHKSLLTRMREVAFQGSYLVDVQSAEIEQRFWLPAYERIEIQARSALSEQFRPAFRIVSTLQHHVLDSAQVAADTTAHPGLTFAPHDSLNDYTKWRVEPGAATTAVHGNDFDDAVNGASPNRIGARVDWHAEHLFDVFRYNKIEGLYTGVGLRGRLFGDSSLTQLVGHGGYSWSSATPSGAVELRAHPSASWRVFARGEHELVPTNDFVPTLEGPATIGALMASGDDYDYVQRSGLTIGAVHALDADRRVAVKLEAGPARDRSVSNHVTGGLIRIDSVFRPNRPANDGSYFRSAIGLQVHPEVSGEYLEPGIGLDIRYERGDGGLHWQRADVQLRGRHMVGNLTYAVRADAALLFGGSPLQKVIEFGENEGLPGYHYKQFGGDRTALARLGLIYSLPVLRSPLRVSRWLTLPGVAPSLALSLQGGWAAAHAAETQRALKLLGSSPTEGTRASVAISLDAFDGAFGLGLARPIGRAAGWTIVLGSARW